MYVDKSSDCLKKVFLTTYTTCNKKFKLRKKSDEHYVGKCSEWVKKLLITMQGKDQTVKKSADHHLCREQIEIRKKQDCLICMQEKFRLGKNNTEPYVYRETLRL